MTKKIKQTDDKKNTPMRMCVGCRQSKPQKELIRMVNDGGKVFIDPAGRAEGRGIYLCKDETCFEKAKKKKAIERALNLKLTEEEMEQLCIRLMQVGGGSL